MADDLLATVKVLPEPVTPSSTWSRSCALMPFDQLGDGGGLVALGLELRDDLEGDAAIGFLGARRAGAE